MEDSHLPCEEHRECAASLLRGFLAELGTMEVDDNVTFFNDEVFQIVSAVRDELDVWLEVHEVPAGELGEEPN